MGYGEVNLNLGCPSGTVVPKGRGSGFLGKPEELDAFFNEVFQGLMQLPEKERFEVSVKTRIGLSSPEEFEGLLAIYDRYPIKELTVHPRVREEFYKGRPHLDAFELALHQCHLPLVYNGDIFTVSDYEALRARFPSLSAVMIGRGLVARPGLVREIQTGRKETKEELAAFTRTLYEGYLHCYQSEVGAMSKMKEVWYYLEWRFPDQKREIKKVKKATREAAYLEAVDGVFTAIC